MEYASAHLIGLRGVPFDEGDSEQALRVRWIRYCWLCDRDPNRDYRTDVMFMALETMHEFLDEVEGDG